ncbi:hypothetical protein [Streptomyces sp. NPDC001828]|uniref:hypothetical protein n=1 Tax=Streptomyces sp. NPDC001828 TaxID=3364615 RepID=UPI0036D037F2
MLIPSSSAPRPAATGPSSSPGAKLLAGLMASAAALANGYTAVQVVWALVAPVVDRAANLVVGALAGLFEQDYTNKEFLPRMGGPLIPLISLLISGALASIAYAMPPVRALPMAHRITVLTGCALAAPLIALLIT